MDWSRQRVFGIVSGVLLGVMLGLLVSGLVTGWSPVGVVFPLVILGVVISNAAFSQSTIRSVVQLIAQRSTLLASGAAPGTTAAARVHRVFGQNRPQAATMLFPASNEPGRLAILRVLPADAAPRTVYALLPARYGITGGAAASVVLDPANPDIAVLDDRVAPEVLRAIDADPRWTTTRIPTFFVRQGGRATVIAVVAALVAGFALGVFLF